MVTPTEIERCLTDLFGADILNQFPDEWAIAIRGDRGISKIGFCTNLTPRTVDEAVRQAVDLIITHHDAWPFLHGMSEACASMLEAHGIHSAYVHLPLDDADFGTSATLAAMLGLCDLERSNLFEGAFHCGRIGEWERGKSLDGAKAILEGALGEPVRAWRNHDRPIERVCIVTGGGLSTNDVSEAVTKGCDAYITGEKLLYTVEYAAFAGIDLLVGSHTGTELPGIESLARRIAERLPDVQAVRLHEPPVE